MKKIKIADSVRIGAIDYSVVDADIVIIEDKCNYIGSIDYDNTQINLRCDINEQRREETFFHELMHGIFVEAGYLDHEEKLVDNLSKVLYQVMKDNYFYDEKSGSKGF